MFHTCALLANGTVECWGWNDAGQLGTGSQSPSNSDVPLASSAWTALGPVTAIAAGGQHTCGLMNGVVYCLGFNINGQLGDYSNSASLVPEPVNLLPFTYPGPSTITAKAITAANANTCALIADGSEQCWGYNFYGDLGNNSMTDTNVPAIVSGLTGATAVTTGGYQQSDHSCALLSNGTAECWGDNSNSQLGNSAAAQTCGMYPPEPCSDTPEVVTGLSGAKAIAAQETTNCALIADGTVQCWGYGGLGDLGNGSNTTSQQTPVPTNALVTSVSWTSGTTSVATIGASSGLATPAGPNSTGQTLITANYSSLTNNTTLTVGTAPAITSANSTSFTLGMFGTFTVTTTGSPTPSLGESGALPGGVTFVDNHDGTGTLSGTPTQAGSFAISFTAQNGISPNATQSFTLTVGQAPAITSASSTTFTVGVAGTFTVTTTGYPTPSIMENGALPGGVSFVDNNDGTGTLSGTPTSGGVFSITFTAANGVGSNATQMFTLTVNQVAGITSPNSATFTVAGSFTVTTVGYPNPSIMESGPLPNGLSFHDNGDGTGTLKGIPMIFNGGDFGITFTVKNGIGAAVTQAFTIIVQQPPAFTSANNVTFAYDKPNSFTVTTTGFPAPSLSEAGALPAGVSFVDNHNGTATLSGSPIDTGTFAIVWTAANVVTNTAQNFTLNVSGLSVSSSTLNFGTVYLNSSNTLSVTLTNVGNSTVTVSGATITPGSAPAAAYKAVSHCGSPLKAGKSCTIAVTFLADAEGTLTATLNITDNAVGSPQQVNLTGNVIDPVAQFSPTKLAFGTHAVSSSTTLPVQLTNSGQTPLMIGEIAIGGTDSGDFSQTNNCPPELTATMSCTISVTFIPAAKGARTGTLIVTDNVAAGQSTAALTGTGK
jgi:hypothetical protein